MTPVQNMALGHADPPTMGLATLIQTVQTPLQSLPAHQQISTPAQLGLACELAEGTAHLFLQIMDKNIKQNCPQN